MSAYLVDKPILEALGLWHQLLGAAIPVAGWSGVPDQIPVIDLKDHRLNKACRTTQNILTVCQHPGRVSAGACMVKKHREPQVRYLLKQDVPIVQEVHPGLG